MSESTESVPLSDLVPDASVAFDVAARGVARVYAEALFQAGEKAGQTDAVLDELAALIEDVFPSQPDFESFLVSPAIGRDRRDEALRRTLAGKASDLFLNFLLVLNRHDRLDLLRPILLEGRILVGRMKGRQHVIVRSAVSLPDDQRDRLVEQLRQAMALEPTLVTVVDPDLIGGITVRVGDWLYDASVKTKLKRIQNQLFERSSYEIQGGRDRFSSPE